MSRQWPGEQPSPVRGIVIVVLGALSTFGPLSMDFYLPSLPGLAKELGVSDSVGQITMSACMVGLAGGQLIYGPLSDRFGRRGPMIAGIAVFSVGSILCALAPSAPFLIAARLLQGLGGSAGIVIARAIVRDLFSGRDAARALSILMGVSGVAPVLAPLAGGALLAVLSWRGLFLVLALIGVGLLLLAVTSVHESLAPQMRHVGGVVHQVADMTRLLKQRRFISYALVAGVSAVTMFTYISMSSFVFQQQYGVTEQGFSLIFATNSVGLIVASQLNARLVRRFELVTIVRSALLIAIIGAVGFVVAGLAGAPLLIVMIPLFFAITSAGFIMPNVTVLALEPVTKGLGAAAALLGMTSFILGAVVPPLVSLGGVSALVMGITLTCSGTVAFLLLLLAHRQGEYRKRKDT